MLSLILFDVDGTLVDSQAHIVGAMESAFGHLGLPAPTRADILGIVGLSLPQAIAVLAPDAPNAALVEAYKAAYMTLRSSHGEQAASPLYDGVQAVLQELVQADTTLMGVATGKSRRGLDHVVDTHDLARFFVTQQCADDHPSKPHPSMALRAMYEAGADQGVMIGDTSYDMEMGRAAGLRTLGVAWGYHSEERLASQADLVIGTPADIPAAIKQLLG